MRIIQLLLVFVYISFVYSQKIFQANYYFINQPCEASESSISSQCPSESPSGFVAKENACIYIRGMINTSTSYNVSSNGDIVESLYNQGDYYCNNPIYSNTMVPGECYQKCPTGINHLVEVNSVSSFSIPNSVLIINSNSKTCEDDWQSTYQLIQYYKLKSCIIDASGKNSYMLDCDGKGVTTYYFSGPYCDTTPKITNLPLNQDSCSQYQICYKNN